LCTIQSLCRLADQQMNEEMERGKSLPLWCLQVQEYRLGVQSQDYFTNNKGN